MLLKIILKTNHATKFGKKLISSKHKFIYLHPPKTAGNSIQSLLLPFCDDRMEIPPNLPAEMSTGDYFDVSGEITNGKHDIMYTYASALGSKLELYKVIMSVRHPFDRALSMYFSPTKNLITDADGAAIGFEKPDWDEDKFKAIVSKMYSIKSFLDYGLTRCSCHIILRYENLSNDFIDMCSMLNLPLDGQHLPN